MPSTARQSRGVAALSGICGGILFGLALDFVFATSYGPTRGRTQLSTFQFGAGLSGSLEKESSVGTAESHSNSALNQPIETSSSSQSLTTSKAPRKKVVYLHFHKAAGTTIIQGFRISRYKFPPFACNGNPQRVQGRCGVPVEYWKLPVTRILDDLKKWNADFVGVEFGWWPLSEFQKIPKDREADFVVTFREPWSRYVSHMRFTKLEAPLEVAKTRVPFNWYTRQLSIGHTHPSNEHIGREHLLMAKRQLDLFDSVFILEDRRFPFLIRQRYGVRLPRRHNLSKARLTKLIQPKRDKAVFIEQNALDYELYEYAKNLSANMKPKSGREPPVIFHPAKPKKQKQKEKKKP